MAHQYQNKLFETFEFESEFSLEKLFSVMLTN